MIQYHEQELLKRAQDIMQRAYSPYSSFKVGAALLSKTGKIYVGCNFESAAFGAGVCAERIALGSAIVNNENEFVAIAVCGNNSPTYPCGICRQALLEFGDIDVICSNSDLTIVKTYKLSELLPYSFLKIVKK
ncbi:MAG: cytidine deaminase [bacterium]|nr:cytidine deaminase [bacterium]